MSEPVGASITAHFSRLDDPRDMRGKEHLLLDIITIALCAVISGAEGWEDIAEYGRAKQAWLSTFLALSHGIPCADTFGRVFARIDPEQMQDCFISWVKAISQLLGAEVVSIDGKTLRHSYDKGSGKAAIHMVSAWASANRLVLGQRKVDDKSNEITAIPALLSVLEISGSIVTIDAMGAQRAIATAIIERQADYVLALKGNQEGLFEDVQWLFEQAQAGGFEDVAYSFAQSIDKGHGRTEIRRCWTLSELGYLVQKPLWTGLQTVVMVQSERHCNGQVSTETRFFISSLPSRAAVLLNAVRTHWSIENSLHWVLDVSFNEDACRIRRDFAPQNFALLRHLALNLLSQDTSTQRGIAARRKKAGWDQAYLTQLLAQ
jgi:predicted transposase YbfD/YdcC